MTSYGMDNTIMLPTNESKLNSKFNSRNNNYMMNATTPLKIGVKYGNDR